MPEPIKDIEDFFNKTTTKLLKTQGKNFIKIYNELIHVTKKRASKLNGSIINLLQLACSWIEDSTCTPIWQPLIDISAEILNCYGSFDSDDAQIFDLLFQPLLEDNSEGRSDLFMFIERILTKIQAGFSFLISDYFKKMFTDALSSNAKSKLQESYNLLQIVHIHIPDSIHTVLHIHHLYLKSENIKQREIGIKFLIDVLSGVYTVKFKQDELPILDDFCARFGDNELSCQQLMVANLSTFLLRSSDITSKLIKPILDCFQSVDTSLSISKAIVEQISIAIKDCYHAAPNELLYLLLSACSHKAPHVAIECIHTCSYLYRIYYVKDTYSSPTRLRLETVPRFILAAAIEHKDIGVRVEAQCCFFQNIIFERYRPLERTRQFFLFAQTDLGRDGIKNYGKLLTSQSELRDLVDKALSKYYSSDNSELFIADESLTELNDDAKRLLQQISDLCFSKKDNGVRKIHNYFSTLDSSFKEELQTLRTDSTLDTSSLSLQKTIIDSADMSKSSLSAQSMLVYERLCPRLQIVFSHDFLEQFPDAAQTYFTEETARNDTDDEEKDMSDSEKANVEQTINNYERRAIRQIGKLAKVICPVIEAAMDVEILEKFVGVIDEQKPVLNTFIYALLADFGGLLNPGALKSDLIDHLFGVIYNDIVNGASTTISKWAIRAFVQIIGSNQNHLEQSYIDLFEKTKSYWILTDEDVAAPSRWLLLSHVVKHAPQTDTMFKIIRHLFKMIRQIAKTNGHTKKELMKNFDIIPKNIQLRVNHLKFLSRSCYPLSAQRIQHEKDVIDEDETVDDQEYENPIRHIIDFLLDLINDVFFLSDDEIGRHYVQLHASFELLRMIEINEIYHLLKPSDYVKLYTIVTHENSNVRHQFLDRLLSKIVQWKLSVIFLGYTIAVPNDSEDKVTQKILKQIIERLYILSSNENTNAVRMKILPEKSISLMIYLHAHNKSLIAEVDKEILDSITTSAKFSLKCLIQCRERPKYLHGTIPNLLLSIKHSRAKEYPDDEDLNKRIYLVTDIFQTVFSELSPLESFEFSSKNNNNPGDPLFFTQPNFSWNNTDSYLPNFYGQKRSRKKTKEDVLDKLLGNDTTTEKIDETTDSTIANIEEVDDKNLREQTTKSDQDDDEEEKENESETENEQKSTIMTRSGRKRKTPGARQKARSSKRKSK